MFGWINQRRKRQPEPEARWSVSVDQHHIHAVDHTGASLTVAKDEISDVVIETNDSGPWGADLWWLIFAREGKLACAFPQGATNEQDVIDYLMGLRGFDLANMVRAMGSTQNALFPVWRKPE